MSKVLFYRGHDASPDHAIAQALFKATPVLKRHPSLIIELEALQRCGRFWYADIRVMGLKREESEIYPDGQEEKDDEHEVKNPAYPRSGDKERRRKNVIAARTASSRFGHAAMAGDLPRIPLEDLSHFADYEVARMTEPEARKMLFDLEAARQQKIRTAFEPVLD
jgi:hypothetical protein